VGSPAAPYRVLFICLGNICRSPIAEVVFRSMLETAHLQDRVVARSAATGEWHVGEPADPSALTVLRAHGYDAGAHSAQKFVRSWFDDYDLLVAMDRINVKALQQLARKPEDAEKIHLLRSFDRESTQYGELDVPDPYGAGLSTFEEVLAIVTAGCRGLLEHVTATIGA
jgi:protein-tyrosine phosphatase